MLEIETIPCREDNHGSRRTEPVSYLVVHYTAGNGDTARDNGRYFARCAVGASAHYFVDSKQVVASVAEENVAWHCGAASYRHPHCRNGNSIGVELCSVLRDGQYAFEAETVENALVLLAEVMRRYELPVERVLRHYDVTGKVCPAPFVADTAGGVLFAKVLNLFSKKKINPMIGAAGISAFPMSSRVIHKMGLKEDPQNFLLMHAAGANVAGQIASVIAGGLVIKLIENML